MEYIEKKKAEENVMSDLISRQAAIDGLDGHRDERRHLNDWQVGWNEALDWVQDIYLEELPSAQPEQKVGKWIVMDDDRISGRCSVCGWEAHMYEDDVVGMDYCPNCGAKMEEQNGVR